MRVPALIGIFFLVSCNNSSDTNEVISNSTTLEVDSSMMPPPAPVWDTAVPVVNPRTNEIFRSVEVDRVGPDSFRIHGEARVTEANVRWIIEDGHNELGTGFTTATIGAPDWGKFDFTISAPKENENTSIHIVLFEESMKNGSRRNSMPIYLY